MSLQYYLGNLGTGQNNSEQAKHLRNIILSNKSETDIISAFKQFVLSQDDLDHDTVSVINRALMTHHGSEYLGLCGDNFLLKSDIYKQFIDKFPNAYSFKFYLADCCLLADKPVEEIYPILKEGMLQDRDNIEYPSSDLFYLIHSSDFSFDFDMLLLSKYYQPCSKITFDEWIREFKEKYTTKEQQKQIENIKWTEPNTED